MQYPLIHIHLQTMACNRGWLEYESGLSNDLHFQSFPKISLAQTKAARLLVVDLRYGQEAKLHDSYVGIISNEPRKDMEFPMLV